MKKPINHLVSVLLVLSFIMSLFLSYHIVFDVSKYGTFSSETLAPQTKDNIEFYEHTAPTTGMLFSPDMVIIHQNQKTYKISSSVALETMGALLTEYPAELIEPQIVQDDDMYHSILSKERIEWNYFAHFPIELLAPYLHITNDTTIEFESNRIVFLKEDANHVYLFNSIDKAYLRVNLSKSVSYGQLHKIAKLTEGEWELVEPMALQRMVAYLPVERVALEVKTYLLEKVPESKLVLNVFGISDYSVGEVSGSEEKKYSTIQTELTLDTRNQMMNYSFKQSQKNMIELNYHKMKESADLVRKNEYWRDTMRYSGHYQSSIVYRRYIDKIPIIHARNRYQMSGIDYATTRIKLGLREYSYMMPTVFTYARIDSAEEVEQLDSYEEVKNKLKNAHLDHKNISRIVLAYDWQENTEFLKVATLIPRWFVEVDGYYFTLEEVTQGKVEEVQRTRGNANGL